MSTRSRIGIQKGTKIRSVYCHWDGYPDGVGKTLLKHYKDEATINKLLDLGDISALGDIPEEDKSYWTDYGSYDEKKCGLYKTRGDKGINAVVDEGEDFYTARGASCYADYLYLFRDGKWFVKPVVETEFVDLEEYIKKGEGD